MCALPSAARSAATSDLPAGNWLDTLRGFAATAVVFFHLNETIGARQQPYNAIVKRGSFGVQVFFVLSGYLIVLTALKRPQAGGFVRRRWWRIYPPYLASLAVVIGVAVLRKLTTGTNDAGPLPAGLLPWLATVTLTTDPVTRVPTINWIYWSLTCEVAFYAFIALFLFQRARHLPLAIAVATWIGVLPGLPAAIGFFTVHWWEFAWGSTLAIGIRRPISAVIALGCAATAIVEQRYVAGAVVAATWLSILWSAQPTGRWLNQDPLFSRVGKISYSLYLTHVPFGVYLLLHYRPLAWTRRFPTHVAGDLLVYVICLGFAWVFWRTVELPSHREGQRR